MIITDNSSATITLAGKQILTVSVYGIKVDVDSTVAIRLSHAAVTIAESSRTVQIFGALSVGLAFYNSLDSIIAQPVFSLQNIVTPDATLIPVDALGLYGKHDEFLAIADMIFNAGAVPTYVKPFASVKVNNTNNVPSDITLTLVSVIERH